MFPKTGLHARYRVLKTRHERHVFRLCSGHQEAVWFSSPAALQHQHQRPQQREQRLPGVFRLAEALGLTQRSPPCVSSSPANISRKPAEMDTQRAR
ncbi:hypothetical protein GN956_G11385 [Arapaima gigas]